MNSDLAVIIPFYQVTSGVLRRALDAAFQQGMDFHVYVVDDGSPISALAEVDGYEPALRGRITVLSQVNQGPGPARNTALAQLPAHVKWIAYLDSDDIWAADHLSMAIETLEIGYDLFMANGADEEGESSATFCPYNHRAIDDAGTRFAFGDDFLPSLFTETHINTSTVVMRRDRLGHLRFPSIRGACEDLYYWLDVAQTNPRVAYTRDCHATAGSGVHTSFVRDWKSNEALGSQLNFANYYRYALSVVQSEASLILITEKLNKNRIDFAITLLAMLKARRVIKGSVVWSFLQNDPKIIVALLKAGLRLT